MEDEDVEKSFLGGSGPVRIKASGGASVHVHITINKMDYGALFVALQTSGVVAPAQKFKKIKI